MAEWDQDPVQQLHNVSVSRIEVMRHATTVHVDFVFIFTSISLIHHQPHYVFQHDSDKPNPIIIQPCNPHPVILQVSA